ncbi:MAG: GNAT family N-acetyltransferase, partial [Pirellulales bacterium]
MSGQVAGHLFGERRYAEVLLAEDDGQVVGFALFFHNYSTFVGKPGIYLEDLFVLPARNTGGSRPCPDGLSARAGNCRAAFRRDGAMDSRSRLSATESRDSKYQR